MMPEGARNYYNTLSYTNPLTAQEACQHPVVVENVGNVTSQLTKYSVFQIIIESLMRTPSPPAAKGPPQGGFFVSAVHFAL